MHDLKTIVELSHEFGTPNYVKGGGGNTSYKNASTLWVKPSGTTLAGLQEETFVTLNRAKVNGLYDVETPEESHAREELVKNSDKDNIVKNTFTFFDKKGIIQKVRSISDSYFESSLDYLRGLENTTTKELNQLVHLIKNRTY